MEDARTMGPSPLRSRRHVSGRRRHERHRSSAERPEGAEDAKTCGAVAGGGGDRSESRGGARLQRSAEHDDARLQRSAANQLPPSRQQLQQQQQHHHHHQSQAVKGDNFEDFKQYLGLTEGPADSLRMRRHRRPASPGVAAASESVACASSDADRRASSAEQSGVLSQQLRDRCDKGSGRGTPPPPPSMAGDSFAEEENFFHLINLMLMQAERGWRGGGGGGGSGGGRLHPWDADSVVSGLRRFGGEFGDCVLRFHSQCPDAFPFYHPEMLKMMKLLSGIGGCASSTDALLFTEQLRSIHLNMRLFLRPDKTVAEVDDATLARLLLTYSEQLDRDLRSSQPPGSKYARGRATALAAAVARYACTAERRRQAILGRMETLAGAVVEFVDGGGSGGAEGGGFRTAVVSLLDDMFACFTCLGSSSGSGAAAADAVPLAAAVEPTRRHDEDDGHDGGGGGCGDSMSAGSRALSPPPPLMLLPVSDTEDAEATTAAAAPVASDSDVGTDGHSDAGEHECGCDVACSPDAMTSVSPASVEPLESLALQLMERLEGIMSSFLPNERVNVQDFKDSFNALFVWWRRASLGLRDKRMLARMTSIRDQYDCTQRLRPDSTGVKRLCSEADTAWDLIEAAKMLLPAEERTVAMATAHTTLDWREATGALVDLGLATLYMYQTAQDASVLSMRLRADLQRLAGRLADCGPVPLLCLLRLRVMYLQARQFSDLQRPHPQGCLIQELAQTHRILRRHECPDGCPGQLSLTVCVPFSDYNKFCQHVKAMRVLSFEARAPVTEKTSLLMKPSCLKKIEKCCQCTIELLPPVAPGPPAAGASATTLTSATASRISCSDDALTVGGGGGRRKPQPAAGAARPSFGLVVRPDSGHGRANAAMRMICDIVGPAGVGDRVKFCGFRLAVPVPSNYRPLTAFADTARPLTY